MILSFNTTPKILAGIFAALLAMLLFCAYKVNTTPNGIALTGYIFACSALVVLAFFTKIDVVFHALRDELEPKTGGTASGSVNTLEPRSHRHDLELALVHSLAPHLVNHHKATGLGAYLRDVADAIFGAGQVSGKHKRLIHGAEICACDLAFERGAHSIGEQADQRAEAEIVAKGLTAPRVTKEQIQTLMSQLTWRYEQPRGTTSTLAHAYLGRFYLVTGHSACVSPENFDAALGMKYAREQAEGKAREKLWELEGYKLYAGMRAQ